MQKLISKPEALLGGKEMKTNTQKIFQSPLVNDSKWAQLSTRERTFVMEVNMKPTTYCTIKR